MPVISQRVLLHQYPVHALEYISALLPSSEQEEMTQKLISLTQAHSRFVLLLQSIVHSSSTPISPEPEEFGMRFGTSPTGLRELTFPAPLSLFDELDSHAVPEMTDTLPPLRGHKRCSGTGPRLGSQTSLTRPSIPKVFGGHSQSVPDRPASMMSNNVLTPSRRRSIFRKAVPPPPPSSEPRSLRLYSANWRRHPRSMSFSGHRGFASEDESVLRHPHRRFASMNVSTDSSLSPFPETPFSHNSIDIESSIRSSSPHDLLLAMSRTRAPILRVFVPSCFMNEHVVAVCEEQLIDSGLWEHLSTGDIICNLGFVPPSAEDNGSDSEDRVSASERDAGGNATGRNWLLFNGHCLVPFSPPEPPPLDDPMTLPSPFYYSHILSPFSNQMYNLALPPSPFDDVPEMTLVYASSKVKSPHSPTGFATVKKYKWIASVTRLALTNSSRFGEGEAIGDGWKGEWILESEGTKEGRQILIDCARGCETWKREWELVREKSGGGRLWLK